jgi:hypothetical protein
MNRYEIRILRSNNKPLVVSATMAGDFYALKRAQALAGDREGYEVWRGMKCIYRSPADRMVVDPAGLEPKAPGRVENPQQSVTP